jgi:hypothetical protein
MGANATPAFMMYNAPTTAGGPAMSKKARALIGIAFAELLLAAIWLYLASLGASHPERVAPGFQRTIGSTMGAAMGAFLGLGLVLFLVAAKRDKQG